MADLNQAIAAARDALAMADRSENTPLSALDAIEAADALVAALDAAQAPPAAAVPRFTDIEAAARYGWEHARWEWENVRIGLGEQAPPAAAHDGLRNAEQTLALLIRKHGDEADAAALATLAAAERAQGVGNE